MTVTGPDGADVPVRPLGTRYGWGDEQAQGVASFRAEQPGPYRIGVAGDHGRLAFGRSIPGAPLYGFGPTLVLATAVVAGCIAGSVVVARRRRPEPRRPPGTEGSDAPGGGSDAPGDDSGGDSDDADDIERLGVHPAVSAVVVVAIVVAVGTVAAVALTRDGGDPGVVLVDGDGSNPADPETQPPPDCTGPTPTSCTAV